jgi:hypothetical protein
MNRYERGDASICKRIVVFAGRHNVSRPPINLDVLQEEQGKGKKAKRNPKLLRIGTR